MTERLEWAFNLYDINRDGLITREEMFNIISAIYELMGRFCEPSVYENTTRDHVEMVFQVCTCTYRSNIFLYFFMKLSPSQRECWVKIGKMCLRTERLVYLKGRPWLWGMFNFTARSVGVAEDAPCL